VTHPLLQLDGLSIGFGDKTVVSLRNQFEYDCVASRKRLLWTTGFSKHMGQGAVVGTRIKAMPETVIGALLVAFVQVFGEYYLPDLALAFMYLVMLLVLVVRPGGLLGKEA